MQIFRQTESADTVNNAEVDGFGAAAHLRRNFFNRHMKYLRRRCLMNILILAERFQKMLILRHMRHNPEFNLRIISRQNLVVSFTRLEQTADFLAFRRAYRDILQIRLGTAEPSRFCNGLVKARMNAFRIGIYERLQAVKIRRL